MLSALWPMRVAVRVALAVVPTLRVGVVMGAAVPVTAPFTFTFPLAVTTPASLLVTAKTVSDPAPDWVREMDLPAVLFKPPAMLSEAPPDTLIAALLARKT